MPRRRKQPSATLNLDGLRDIFEERARKSGAEVRARRKALHLTLEQLANLIGDVPMQTISKVERGEITPRDYLKAALALRLGCPIEDLFPFPPLEDLARAAA